MWTNKNINGGLNMLGRKFLFSAALAVLLTWVWSPILQAQPSLESDMKFYGRVVDTDGRPVADALVDLQVSSAKEGSEKSDTLQVHTDADGRFELNRPGKSLTILNVRKKDYELAPTAEEPGKKFCVDCHGSHKLPFRNRNWDKKTGKLL